MSEQVEKVQSTLVWATLYQLKTYDVLKDGTWKVNGTREDLGSKLVSRQHVEKFNHGLKGEVHLRNKMYVTDEAKTKELMKDREVSIQAQAVVKKKEQVGQSDMVDAILNLASNKGGAQPKAKKVEDMDVKELKVYCINNDIDFHHASGKAKLLENIHNANK